MKLPVQIPANVGPSSNVTTCPPTHLAVRRARSEAAGYNPTNRIHLIKTGRREKKKGKKKKAHNNNIIIAVHYAALTLTLSLLVLSSLFPVLCSSKALVSLGAPAVRHRVIYRHASWWGNAGGLGPPHLRMGGSASRWRARVASEGGRAGFRFIDRRVVQHSVQCSTGGGGVG